MANRGAASKAHRRGNLHVPHAGRATLKAAKLRFDPPARGEFRAPDSRNTNPIPVCSDVNDCDARRAVDSAAVCLWMDSAPGCADSANHISWSSTGPFGPSRECSRQRRFASVACWRVCV